MAEEKSDLREAAWRQMFPWTELFRCFKVAVDPNKLLLAAAGIFAMAVGWWLLALLFGAPYQSAAPLQCRRHGRKGGGKLGRYKAQRDSWNLMHRTAGVGQSGEKVTFEDLAESPAEYEAFQNIAHENNGMLPESKLLELQSTPHDHPARAKHLSEVCGKVTKQYATLATWPWFENRGPNPYLMVTGQARGELWEPGHFWEWFTGNQLPVMFEPLVKIVRPIIYYFSPRAGLYPRIYFLFVTLWTVAVWSVFGGAITRIAAVEVARGEKIGLGESIRFTTRRWMSYLSAPLFPLLFVFFLLVLTWIYGLFYLIPFIGDIFVAGFSGGCRCCSASAWPAP